MLIVAAVVAVLVLGFIALAVLAKSALPEGVEQLVINLKIDQPPNQTEWKFRTDGTGKSYFHVDLSPHTCTCDDFVSRRSRFEFPDVRRLCGHMIRAYQKAEAWPEPDGIVAAMFSNGPPEGGCWAYDRILRTKLSSGEHVYFGEKHDRDWIDVYAKARRKGDEPGKYTGAYGRYGFDRANTKWAFGNAPPGAREIRGILKVL